jgi:hypothetical protein
MLNRCLCKKLLQADLQLQVQASSQLLHSVLHPIANPRDIRHPDDNVMGYDSTPKASNPTGKFTY